MTRLSSGIGFLFLVTLLCTACSKDKRRAVYPVHGQVTFEGKPTPNALIIFHPVNDPDPNAPHPLTRVGEDGSYSLTTYNMKDGAPAGEYTVTITWVPDVDQQSTAVEDQKPLKNGVPDRYAKSETSGLRATVKPGPNEFPFELTKN